MRHKYSSEVLVLGRHPYNEAGSVLSLLSRDLGLIHARAEGVRRSGARLAHALQTLSLTHATLVRGKEVWRVTGATLEKEYVRELGSSARNRIARVSGLLQRILAREDADERIFECFHEFLQALTTLKEEEQNAAETLVVLRILSILGFDAGDPIPEGYGPDARAYVDAHHKQLIARVNKGIAATGL